MSLSDAVESVASSPSWALHLIIKKKGQCFICEHVWNKTTEPVVIGQCFIPLTSTMCNLLINNMADFLPVYSYILCYGLLYSMYTVHIPAITHVAAAVKSFLHQNLFFLV